MIDNTEQQLRSLQNIIARGYIKYCEHMPNHKGRYRVAKILDNWFKSFKVKTPSGPILEVFLSSSMDLSYYYAKSNNSHQKILEVMQKIEQGDIFIDIGANIGFYALLAAKIVGKSGRVLSFEPSPREFRRLLKNIELNHSNNLIPYNVALSDYVGESKFFIAQSHTGLNSLSNEVKDNQSCISVPVYTGDMLLEYLDKNINKIIKIDVEGAEFCVLSGMKSFLKIHNIKSVIVEITPDFLSNFGHNKDMIYTLMQECGFTPTVQSTEWQYDEVFIR